MKYDLLGKLKSYRASDIQETDNVAKTIEFLSNTGKPFDRETLEGHIVGSAFVLNKDKTKVLLTHHKKLNKWLQLGGHSDGNDNTPQVALREAIEESGIHNMVFTNDEIADVDVQIIPENEKKRIPPHVHYDVWYFLQAETEDFTISDESNTLKWFSMKELNDLYLDDAALNRAIKKWKVSVLGEKK